MAPTRSIPVCACCLLLATPALANTQLAQTRQIDFDAQRLQVASFYRSGATPPARSADADRAWGIKMASELPLQGVRATLDYALTAVPGRAGEDAANMASAASFTAGENHLMQLRLDSQWQDVSYGLRYFSAGADFGSIDLGRDLLSQAGLPAATDGTEVWARLMVADIELQPSARRMVHDQGDGQQTDNQYVLSAARQLHQDTHLRYDYRTSTSVTERAGRIARTQETNQTSLQLHASQWRLAWEGQVQTRHEAEHELVETTSRLWADVKLLESVTLSPSLTRRRADLLDATATQGAAAALSLGYQPSDVLSPGLNLTLRYDQQQQQHRSSTELSADFGIRKSLQLPGAQGARTSLSAALSYRRSEDSLNGARDDQLGVRVTFEHAVGG